MHKLMSSLVLLVVYVLLAPSIVVANGGWEQVGTSIQVPDGYRIYNPDISDDGLTALASFYIPDDENRTQQKVVRIYDLNSGDWVQRGADLVGPVGVNGRVKLSGDGNTVAIGGTTGRGDAGSLLVYNWSNSTSEWNQKGDEIVGGDGSQSTQYGLDVSISGNTLAVTEFYGQSIKVYDFESGAWSLRVSPLTGFDIRELSLARDGDFLAFSYMTDGDTAATEVLDWNPQNQRWDLRGQIINGPSGAQLQFISLSESGDVLHTTTPKFSEDFNFAGLVRVYRFSTDLQEWKLVGNEIRGQREDHRLSLEVVENAISDDGSIIVYEEVDIETQKVFFRIKQWSERYGWLDLEPLLTPLENEFYIRNPSISGNGEFLTLAVKDEYLGPGFMKVLKIVGQDGDEDGVPDAADLYPNDATQSLNTPYRFSFHGTIDFASDSSEGKVPHGVKAGEAYRYTIVVDNHGGSGAGQSWDRSDIEYLILTLNDDEDASVSVDIANMRTVFGFGSSLTSPDPTLTSDESGALTKTWTNALFFGYSDDAVMDWYQNYGWLDDGIMVTQRLQALSDTVAEAIGPFSNQSGFAFTGVNQSARIEDPSEWSAAQSAECPGPLTVTNQQEANDVLSNLCVRIRGDLNIKSASLLDLTPLRIVRTIDGSLNIDLPENTALDGLQGASHVNGAAVSDQDGDYHPDFMDHYPMDPAAAFDSDGDGMPDNWLPGFFGSNVTPDLAVDSDDDGDGVSDFEDAFPLDASESVDTDGDGIGNNADEDDDGDGVPDSLDAFPDDPAASVDGDEDGYPDTWNTNATLEEISASGLVLDALPLDPLDYIDTDGDGLGQSIDIDDSNAVVGFALEEDFDLEVSSSEAFTATYPAFEPLVGASVTAEAGRAQMPPLGHIEDFNPPAGFAIAAPYSGNTYFYSEVSRSTPAYDYIVGVRVGQHLFGFHPGLEADGIRGHFRHEYAADGSPDFELNVAGENLDMGFLPSAEVMHATEVWVNGETGSVLVRVTDGADSENVFEFRVVDQRLRDTYRLGFVSVGRNEGMGTGYFDTVRVANRSNLPIDTDADGVPDPFDAFLNDPAASVDTDGDGMPDEWNEGKSEADSTSDPVLILDDDDDNDRINDLIDAFPLDPEESVDTDGDGVGDNADEDDDGDGLLDAEDLFPRVILAEEIIDEDLTVEALGTGIVEYGPRTGEDGAILFYDLSRSFSIKADGSFRGNDYSVSWGYGPFSELYPVDNSDQSIANTSISQAGEWQPLQKGYKLKQSPIELVAFNIELQPKLVNVAPSIQYGYGIPVPISVHPIVRLALVGKGETTWRLALQQVTEVYITDPELVVDMSKPVYVEESEFEYIEILSPDVELVPFTAPELIGDAAIWGLNEDDRSLAANCSLGAFDNYVCSDIVRFNADGTAFLKKGGRSALWTLAEGQLELQFVDNGTVLIMRRIAKGEDFSTVLMAYETPTSYRADITPMLKADIPAPENFSNFLGSFLANLFPTENKSVIDGGKIDAFGFLFDEDGTGVRFDAWSYEALIGDVKVLQGVTSTIPLNWSQSGNVFESVACVSYREINGEESCWYQQTRTWEFLKITDERFYVYRSLRWDIDLDQNGELEYYGEVQGPNAYQRLDYYDINDADRDGYPNDIDVFPTDEFEWSDVDGDGIGDNSEDSDEDGVADGRDDFPLDPAASLDTDGDGMPDDWNPGYSVADSVSDPPLVIDTDDDNDGVEDVLDVFPLDVTEWADADNDDVGDNADLFPANPNEAYDYDSDGVGDNSDNCMLVVNADQIDTDGDGEGDACDFDDDNDGFTDEQELIDGTNPLDARSCLGCYSVFDVDADGEVKALSDGLLLIRYFFGFTGDTLVGGAVNNDGERTSAEEIESYLESHMP